MDRVTVIGLGDLGLACASRLHEVGLQPLGVDPAPARQAEWRAATGLTAAASLESVTADRVLVCVRTTEQAESVLTQLRGQAHEGALAAYVITTLEPSFARRLGDLAGNGMRVIELPVSGGRAGARRGDLTVMIGGGLAAPEDADFLRSTLADHVFEFPRFGDATIVKLLNNVLGAYNAAAFAGIMSLADGMGIDPATCAAVIRTASGSSWMAEHFEALVDDLLVKDAGLLAGEVGASPIIDLADAPGVLAGLATARALISSRPQT
jgi:3-hydroxyisobutyrate dehydrogenase